MPIALPALAIELGPIVLVVALLLLFFVAEPFVKSLLHPLTTLPLGIGHAIKGIVDYSANMFHSLISFLLADRAAHLAAFFTSLSHELTVGWDSVGDFATRLEADFKHWASVGLHDTIKAFTNPVLAIANRAHALAETAEADLIDLGHDIDRRFHNLRDWVETEVFGKAMAGIDKLRHDIFDQALPALRHDIGSIAGQLRGDIATVERDVTDVASRLADLAKELGIPLSVIEALIAAIGIDAAIEAVETLGTCRGKLKTLCTSDPAQWANLIEGLALLALFPGLVELTKLAQGVIGDHRDTLRDVITNGQTVA